MPGPLPGRSAVAAPGRSFVATHLRRMDVELGYVPGLDDGAPHVAVDLVAGACGPRHGPGPGWSAVGRLRCQAGPSPCGLVPQDPHEEISGPRGDLAGEHTRGDEQKELEECGGVEPERGFAGRLGQT